MAGKNHNGHLSTPAESGRREAFEELRRHLDGGVARDDQREIGGLIAEALENGLTLGDCIGSVGETADYLISETFEALRAGEIDATEAERFLQSELSSVTTELQRGVDAAGHVPSPESNQASAIEQLGIRELVDVIPVPTFVIDDAHTVIAYNQGTARLLGIECGEEIGSDCRGMVARAIYTDGRREMALADKVVEAPRRADEMYDVDRVDDDRLYTDRIVYEDTSTMLNRRGEEIPIAFIATPIFDDDGLVGVLELFEQREAGLERFPGLAGVISHDIRNPLGVLNTYVELSEGDINEEHYESIQRNLDRIENIIDDVMTFSQQADSDQELQVFDLERTARDVWRTVETGEATFVTRSVTVEADQPMVERLLENLFENAIEHGSSSTQSETAAVDVTVRLGPLADGFYVEDTGSGIPAEDRGTIFQHGYSTESTGTGFGLSIVHKIAERHGWSIAATDSEEGGARFEITGVDGT